MRPLSCARLVKTTNALNAYAYSDDVYSTVKFLSTLATIFVIAELTLLIIGLFFRKFVAL